MCKERTQFGRKHHRVTRQTHAVPRDLKLPDEVSSDRGDRLAARCDRILVADRREAGILLARLHVATVEGLGSPVPQSVVAYAQRCIRARHAAVVCTALDGHADLAGLPQLEGAA